MDRRLQDRFAVGAWSGVVRSAEGGCHTTAAHRNGRARPAADAALPDRHPAAEARRRDQWIRIWKRSQLPGKLIAFFEELNESSTREQVMSAVAEHAAEMVGGYRALVFRPEEATEGTGGPATMRGQAFGEPGLVAAPDFPGVVERWWGEAAALLADPEVAMVAHVPFGEEGVLLVAERRGDRVFDEDDWEVLATLAEQGVRAISRLPGDDGALERALPDPLSRPADPRQLEVVLKHAWSAAERGEGLAVVILDLDGLQAVHDEFGAEFADQIMGIAAACLREEARGADALLRYGPDEFLVIQPRGTASGARALATRTIERLQGWVSASAGVAEYHPSYSGARELVRAAERELRRGRARLPD